MLIFQAVFHFCLQINEAHIIECYIDFAITNTYTTYLIFLAYLIFTEFEQISMFCRLGPRLTSLFPMKARQQANPPREDSQS